MYDKTDILESWIVWSETGGPGGPAQDTERLNVGVITSCPAGLESSQRGNCGRTVAGDLLVYRALAVKKMVAQIINHLNKSRQKSSFQYISRFYLDLHFVPIM